MESDTVTHVFIGRSFYSAGRDVVETSDDSLVTSSLRLLDGVTRILRLNTGHLSGPARAISPLCVCVCVSICVSEQYLLN